MTNASPEDCRPPAFADEALALSFAERHADAMRYVAAWGKWLIWDGARWKIDDTLLAFDRARAICRRASAECNNHKAADALASAKTVAAIERLAKADRRLAATVSQWDTDPWALNTPDGVVNLTSGDLRAHNPNDYLTKMAGVAPNPSCATPNWLAFLQRVTNADVELISFLQRVSGYALTGDTREHAMFFKFGLGANGKTTFINAIAAAMGEYHTSAPIETFTASHSERHPTELAGLRGARLVTSVETEEGRRWAEAKIKALTGGDKISARLMRQDFFEFTPQFKLIIAGNHKPSLRTVDEAMRRRFHLIPFAVTIPAAERDPDLPAKLKEELPGILAWCIAGCLEWQQRGLAPPKIVTDATSEYLTAEDALAGWIDANCKRDHGAWESTSRLFADWADWAGKTGEFVGSLKRFADNLQARGFQPHRQSYGRGFLGLRLSRLAPHADDGSDGSSGYRRHARGRSI